jgi:hypothetical protein
MLISSDAVWDALGWEGFVYVVAVDKTAGELGMESHLSALSYADSLVPVAGLQLMGSVGDMQAQAGMPVI